MFVFVFVAMYRITYIVFTKEQQQPPQPPPVKTRSRHKTLVYGVAGDDMRMVQQAAAAAAAGGQPEVYQVSSRSTGGHPDPGQAYQVNSRSTTSHLDGSQALPGPGQIYHQLHPRQKDCGAQVSQEDLEADAAKFAELERWQYEVIMRTPFQNTHCMLLPL